MTTPIQIPTKRRAQVEKAARALGITAQVFIAQAIEEHLGRFRSPDAYQTDKLHPMLQTARVRISRGGRVGEKHDPLVLAANTAHHTLRTLAATVGCSQPSLTQARHGAISISMERAKKIESICGFKATRKHWPRLRADETKQEGRKNHGRKPKKKTQPKKGAR